MTFDNIDPIRLAFAIRLGTRGNRSALDVAWQGNASRTTLGPFFKVLLRSPRRSSLVDITLGSMPIVDRFT
jgi:hypothetical protein